MGLALKYGLYTPYWIPMEKTKLSYLSYQMEIASGLGMEHVSTFPLSAGTSSGSDPFMSCACFHSLWEFIGASALLCLEGLAAWCPPSPLALRIFPLPFL